MTDRRIIVHLSGGLGNQMFQYAAARALALRLQGDLVLDTWSGFVRDRVYRRTYELAPFPIVARPANLPERLPFWVDRVIGRFNRSVVAQKIEMESAIQGRKLREIAPRFLPELVCAELQTPLWMTGYWQSFKYFAGCESTIARELSPPPPQGARYRDLGARMRSEDSVAVGIRLYEESPNPYAQSKDGGAKTFEQINIAIDQMARMNPAARFYIFCTHHAAELDALNVPGKPTFVTRDEGYDGAVDSLWLLQQCRHHIFTNSTFYWWGAWLAEQTVPESGHTIWAADNFINDDGLVGHWRRF